MKVTKRLAVAAVGLSVAGTLIGAGVASADPSAPPTNAYDRPVHGVGSDTTDLVMNGLAEAVVGDHDNNPGTPDQKLMASWDAKSTAGFKTRATGCDYTGNPTPDSAYVVGARPNGSGNGAKALRDAAQGVAGVAGCLDFARSSSNPNPANLGTTEVKALHLAQDGLAFALHKDTLIPRTLTKAQLQAAYHCTFGGFTTGAWKAIIPQAGSGTRSSWLAFVGLNELTDGNPNSIATVGSFPCVTDQANLGARGGANPWQEHDLRPLTKTTLSPVSTAQWISQMGGAATDVRGSSMLGTITDGVAGGEFSYPISLNTAFGDLTGTTNDLITARTVYNAVPTKYLTGGSEARPFVIQVFEGGSSKICQRSDVIKKFGFVPVATCGTGSIINPQP